MTTAHKLTTALCAALFAALSLLSYGWLKEHDARLVLSTQQTATTAALATIKSNEEARQATLTAALNKIETLKANTKTITQIVQAQPQLIPNLPAPIREVTPTEIAAAPTLKTGDVVIPAADVKPVFNAEIEATQCKATLESDTTEIADYQATVVVKDKQITQLTQALKGGTKLARIKTGLKWFGTGVAVVTIGAVVLLLHH